MTSLTLSITGATVGHLLCVGFHIYSPGTASISDGSNVYTQQKTVSYNSYEAYIYTAPITTGGNLSVVIQPAGGSTAKYVSACWGEYSYTPGATLTIPDGASSNGSTSSTASTGNIALTTPDLVYAVCAPETQSITGAGGGLTLRSTISYSNGSTLAIADGDALNASSSPVNGTFSLSNNSVWAALGIGIVAVGGGAVDVPYHLLLSSANFGLGDI